MQDDATLVHEALARPVERICGARQVWVDVLGEDLALVAPAAQQVAPGEGLARNGVVRRSRRQDLVDRDHLAGVHAFCVILG